MVNYLLVFLRGMMMGAADIVPGVSGGTIAFVSGIYERLLLAINSFVPSAYRLIKDKNFKMFIRDSDLVFLVTLLLGILTSVFSLATAIAYAIVEHPIQVWSFFCGLIVASAVIVGSDIARWRASTIAGIALGVVVALVITMSKLVSIEPTLVGAFISGMVAISAMILPGISGSFLLLLLGTYSYVIGAIKALDVTVIFVFALGCGVSLLITARLIVWTLSRYRDVTLAFLLGLMLGSINKIWPWKQTLSYRLNSSGESVPLEQVSVLPREYAALMGAPADIVPALVWFSLGLVSITVIVVVLKLSVRSQGSGVTNGNV